MDFLSLLPPEIAAGIETQLGESPVSSWTDDPLEYERQMAELSNRQPGSLTGLDCPLCLNRGYSVIVDAQGNRRVRDCPCMKQRRALKNLEKSGLAKVLNVYTFDGWQIREPWQGQFLQAAKDYADKPAGWFCAVGRPGTGKTHLCTAICGELLEKGLEVRYVLWRDFSTRAKALVNDDEAYRALLEPLERVRVLYLDDLFKTGKGQTPTAADCNLAFELLNARYADPDKLTVISSELTMGQLLDIDEAIGSRIYERSKGGHYIDLSGRKNWRMGA